jgi:hypothetical protein
MAACTERGGSLYGVARRGVTWTRSRFISATVNSSRKGAVFDRELVTRVTNLGYEIR